MTPKWWYPFVTIFTFRCQPGLVVWSMATEPLVIRNHGYRRKFLVIVFSEHCFVTSEAPNGFPELSSIPPKSEKWDLQFGSGPRPSNKQESWFLMIYMFFFEIVFAFVFEISWGSTFNANWIGRGRGRLRPVQNDRTDCRNVLGWFLANNSLKKQWKSRIFCVSPLIFLGFPG